VLHHGSLAQMVAVAVVLAADGVVEEGEEDAVVRQPRGSYFLIIQSAIFH